MPYSIRVSQIFYLVTAQSHSTSPVVNAILHKGCSIYLVIAQSHSTINVKPDTISGAINVQLMPMSKLSMPNTGHNLKLSMSNRTLSRKLVMPNTGHNLELSMSNRTRSRKQSMPNTGHNLEL